MDILLKPIISILTFLTFPFMKKLKEINTEGESCEAWNKAFFSIFNEKTESAKLTHKTLSTFIHKKYGVSAYQNDKPHTQRTGEDLVYVGLGAFASRQIGLDIDALEELVAYLQENNNTIKIPQEQDLPESDFSYEKDQSSRYGLLLAYAVVARSGSTSADTDLNVLLYKKRYILDLVFPNFNKVEEYIICSSILLKYKIEEKSLLHAVIIFNLILMYLIGGDKIPDYLRNLTKRCL